MRLVCDGTTGTFNLALTPAGSIDPGIGNGGALKEGPRFFEVIVKAAPHNTAAARTPPTTSADMLRRLIPSLD